MAFPTDKTNAVDNTTDVLASHINNIEDKIGLDSSADADSLDYRVGIVEDAVYTWKGAWVTATAYVVNDTVEEDGSGYVCVEAHTSGTFTTDLAASKWELYVTGVDADNIASSIVGVAGKTTPVDADTLPMIDSADSNSLKELTWANIKATIKTYYDSVTATLTNKTLTNPTVNFTDKAVVQNVNCYAYLSASQLNLVNGAVTLIDLNTENYDIGSDFNTSTHKFTAPVTGYYDIRYQVGFNGVSLDKRYLAYVYKNTSTLVLLTSVIPAATISGLYVNASGIVHLTATDTLDLRAESESGDNTVDVVGGNTYATYLAITLMSQ